MNKTSSKKYIYILSRYGRISLIVNLLEAFKVGICISAALCKTENIPAIKQHVS